MIGEGLAACSVKLDLPLVTLVGGATTRAGMLTNPLRDRFGIVARLEFYTPRRMARHRRAARPGLLNVDASTEARVRDRAGARRIANRLLRRVRDYIDEGDGASTLPGRRR